MRANSTTIQHYFGGNGKFSMFPPPQKKAIRTLAIERRGKTLSLFANDKILCLENLKDKGKNSYKQ